MAWYVSGGLLIFLVVGAMSISLPVAFAFLLAGVVGALVFIGGIAGLEQLVANATTAITSFTLVTIPLFILMGELFFHCRVSERVFGAMDKLFGGLPARLSYMTVTGGTLFATLSGSSMANTALLGSALLPEMQRRGYRDHLSMGPIVACGALAILIPPSGLAVLMGSLARLDIGQLLLAGLLPGLLLAGMYLVAIRLLVAVNPDAAPRYDVPRVSWAEAGRDAVLHLLPMLAVVALVVGVIVLGVATPTESAAFGVLGVGLIAACYRSISLGALARAVVSTARVSGMVFIIVIGSATFSQLLAFSGATRGLIGWATVIEVAPVVLLLAMLGVLLFLDLFMESASILLLTVPIFFPLAASLGYDPIWFGIVLLVSLEIGLVTPPLGMGLFVLLGVAPKGTTLTRVSLSVLPYLACMVLLVGLLILFPGIVTGVIAGR